MNVFTNSGSACPICGQSPDSVVARELGRVWIRQAAILFAEIFLLLFTLTGCQVTLENPAKAFGIGTQKDRTVQAHKNWFGVGIKVPLTDSDAHAHVTYNPDTKAFDADLTFNQNWSNTLTLENARIKDNQALYFALTTAQQEVFDRQIDAWKDFGNHAIDAAAQAIGMVAKSPGGGPQAAGLVSSLLGSVGPQMVPAVMAALTKHSVPIAPTPGGP